MIEKSLDLMIDEWEQQIKQWIISSRKKTIDPMERVKPIDKQKITIYDFSTYKRQKNTQKRLTIALPELKDLINSKPAILDQEWPIDTYLELILNHYMIIIKKMRNKLCQKEKN